MSTRVKVAVFVAVAILLTVTAVGIIQFVSGGDEDRPPIIVRSGSVWIDGGDPQDSAHWKSWTKKDSGSAKQWKPDHAKGARVVAFWVSVANADAGSPSNPCPALPFVGTSVAIEYTVSATTATSVITIGRDAPGSNLEPIVDAPADLTATPASGSTPPRLTYDPGTGWISKVTISAPSGLNTVEQSCSFNKPDGTQPGKALITIKPIR